jgi:DNA repair protein RecO (recombination protein O)
MLVSTRALVLSYIRYRESSIIVRCYTEALGTQSYIVNGVRSVKGQSKIGYYQPLAMVNLVVYHRPANDLNRISQIEFSYPALLPSQTLTKATIRLFLSEVLTRVLQEPEGNEAKFAYILTSIEAFEHAQAHLENFHIQFLLGLAKRLGFGVASASQFYSQLNTAHGTSGSEEATALRALLDSPYFETVVMTNNTRKQLLDSILKYYYLHVAGMPSIRSLDVLHALFA